MTELIWDGKYKDDKKVGPIRIELPFQTVETVNETAQQRQLTLDRLFSGQETEWRNRLIWGDKKYVLPSLLQGFAGKVKLIYIDPPFATGADFSFTASIPESDESFYKEPSIIEQKAYRDTWGRGLDGYVQWFYEAVALLRELLAEDGSIYVHCDYRVSSCLRLVLDELLGANNFINEIVWKRGTPRGNASNHFSYNTDSIFLYSKTDKYIFNLLYSEHNEGYLDKYYSQIDEKTGKKFQATSLIGHAGINPIYEWRGFTKPWRYPKHRLDQLDVEGRIYWPKTGDGIPRFKRFIDETLVVSPE